jgi:hypothetical protein
MRAHTKSLYLRVLDDVEPLTQIVHMCTRARLPLFAVVPRSFELGITEYAFRMVASVKLVDRALDKLGIVEIEPRP